MVNYGFIFKWLYLVIIEMILVSSQPFFFKPFLYSSCLPCHTSQSHSFLHPFVSSFCPCNPLIEENLREKSGEKETSHHGDSSVTQ